MKIFGFTILRNGVKYDYPFRESLRSLAGLCEEVFVALGNSDDSTEEELRKLPSFEKLRLIRTTWDPNKRKGGEILSEQTNIALDSLRENYPGAWGFYLQADEVLHEAHYERIRQDLATAEREDADALSLRYLHFWQRYDALAYAKRWYPQEIRAVRLFPGIESYGDAQSFRSWKKRHESDAFVYHYGHVREAKAYTSKKNDFHRWWHPDSELAGIIAKGEKNDRKEPVLPYYGPHPAVMTERMMSHGFEWPSLGGDVLVFGSKEDFTEEFLRHLPEGLDWTLDAERVLSHAPSRTVLLRELPLLAQLKGFGRYKTKVPSAMLSPQARPWTKEFQAVLRMSEKRIAVRG